MHKEYVYSFEKLQVWNDARELVKITYENTCRFPSHERYALSNQMRRAAISISSNIAEGSGRTSSKDQAHFYQVAFSSLLELVSQYYVALDLDYINTEDVSSAKSQLLKVSNKINALRKMIG